MRVFFDHLGFLHRYGGVPKYYVEILKRFPKEYYYLSVPVSNNDYINDIYYHKYFNFLPRYDFKGKYTIMNYMNKFINYFRLKSCSYNIYHQTLYDTYAFDILPKHIIYTTTMHDMNYVKIPHLYQYRNPLISKMLGGDIKIMQKKSAERADHIIAISKNTRKDLIEEWNVDPNKITVIYHGVNKVERVDSLTRIYNRPYFLYVGSRAAYKNFNVVLQAFSRLVRKNIDVDLVCTGNEFSSCELKQFQLLSIHNRIFHISASEFELNSLYHYAIAFIYPSFYEGFGMPILEAMANHCPNILSYASCFPEIAGDAALFFDPFSAEDLYYKMLKIMHDSSLRDELIDKGKIRVSHFSWEKCADEHIKLYKSLL